MTTTVIYTCDRCQKPQQDRHENGGYPPLWTVAIHCQPIDNRDRYMAPTRYQSAELCRACVDELGIMKPLLRGEAEQKAPTLDDMVRAIIRDVQENGE